MADQPLAQVQNLLLNPAAWPAGGRHAQTAIGTALTLVGALHFVTPEQLASLKTGVDQISQGLASLWVVLGPLLAGYAAKWGMSKAVDARDPVKMADALTRQVPGTTVVAPAAVAAALPANAQVVSNSETQVVQKAP